MAYNRIEELLRELEDAKAVIDELRAERDRLVERNASVEFELRSLRQLLALREMGA